MLGDKQEIVASALSHIAGRNVTISSAAGAFLARSALATATLQGLIQAAVLVAPGGSVHEGNGAVELIEQLSSLL